MSVSVLSGIFRKQLVPDVARCRRESDPAGLPPLRSVELLFIADVEATRYFLCNEDRVTHLSPGKPIPLRRFLSKGHAADFETRQFLTHFSTKAFLVAFVPALPSARKHPKPVHASPNQQDLPPFHRNEL